MCQRNGTWSSIPDDLPHCEAKTCQAPLKEPWIGHDWHLDGNIVLDPDLTISGTTITISCPKEQYLYEPIHQITAICSRTG